VGNYYLIVHVNADRMQWETDYANNVLAAPVELHPYIELLLPYCGHFADNRTPLTLQWRDVDPQHASTIRLAVDDDADPTNGVGHQWLATGLPEDPDGVADRIQVMLPELTPRLAPYYVWAEMSNDQGGVYSQPIPIRVFERAYRSAEFLDQAIGGMFYSILGIEAGVLDEAVHYRVLTNFPPAEPGYLGGDIYINVDGTWQAGDGTVHGIALNAQTGYRTPILTPADLYTFTTFRRGVVRLEAGRTYAVRLNDRVDHQALWFDGVDGWVSTGFKIDQSASTVGATFEAWVYPQSGSSGNHHVISTDDGGDDWSVLRRGGTWQVYTGEANRSTGLSVDVGRWQHIAAVFIPGVGVEFFKNGQSVLVPHIAYSTTTSTIAVGRNPGSTGFFDGGIDEVRIWQEARTGEQIRANMYRSLAGDESGLLAYWKFDEGSGQTAADSSPNGRTATRGATSAADEDDPAWGASGAFVGGVVDTDGRRLDGEFACAFPSGDSRSGGSYVALLMVAEDYPNVIGMTPAPSGTLEPDTGWTEIAVQFDSPLEPATLWSANFSLLGSGDDGSFDEDNEIVWPIQEIVWNSQTYTATLQLAGHEFWSGHRRCAVGQ
jgi:hypothetical protein